MSRAPSARGDPDALALVYARFGPLVYSIALWALGARPDDEDVTQQAFVSAWHSQDSFVPGRGTLGGWLVAITRSKVAARFSPGSGTAGSLLQVAGGARLQAPEAHGPGGRPHRAGR